MTAVKKIATRSSQNPSRYISCAQASGSSVFDMQHGSALNSDLFACRVDMQNGICRWTVMMRYMVHPCVEQVKTA